MRNDLDDFATATLRLFQKSQKAFTLSSEGVGKIIMAIAPVIYERYAEELIKQGNKQQRAAAANYYYARCLALGMIRRDNPRGIDYYGRGIKVMRGGEVAEQCQQFYTQF